MRMDGQDESSNIEDVRDRSSGGGVRIGGGIGVGTVVVALVAWGVFGINPLTTISVLSGGGTPVAQQSSSPAPHSQQEDAQAKFVSQVLRSTEVVWTDVFRAAGRTYQAPKLVLYRGSYPTACGQGQSAMGPFYCPGDSKVYLDLGFFDTMRRQLGASGDFAQAYVVAHEVGHHVQHLLGITDKVDAARRRQSEAQANAMSVRVELQADCLAGVWAAKSQQENGWRLEQGDVEKAINAAQQIGDDTLQRRSQGAVVPESFTHGTSAQRVNWLKRGMQSGDVNACDTFDARNL
ncbi:MAG: neutral zinc metallopeptidase [Xenophilus sp.]